MRVLVVVSGFIQLRHSQGLVLLLGAQLMIRWTSIIGALMLALAVWTGGTARAAEPYNCISATSEMACHFNGERDKVPFGQEQGVGHCHIGCSGYQLSAPADQGTAGLEPSTLVIPAIRHEAGVPSHGPGALLRPPIA